MQTTKVTLALIFGSLGCVSHSDETTGAQAEADAGEVGLLECVAPAVSELAVTLEPSPPETGPNSLSFHGTCTVTSVSSSPVSIALTCDDPINPIAFSLNVAGLSDATVTDTFELGASVELEYATIYHAFQSPAWAAIRRQGETRPSLVAVRSPQPLPWFEDSTGFMSPLGLAFVAGTDCGGIAGLVQRGTET